MPGNHNDEAAVYWPGLFSRAKSSTETVACIRAAKKWVLVPADTIAIENQTFAVVREDTIKLAHSVAAFPDPSITLAFSQATTLASTPAAQNTLVKVPMRNNKSRFGAYVELASGSFMKLHVGGVHLVPDWVAVVINTPMLLFREAFIAKGMEAFGKSLDHDASVRGASMPLVANHASLAVLSIHSPSGLQCGSLIWMTPIDRVPHNAPPGTPMRRVWHATIERSELDGAIQWDLQLAMDGMRLHGTPVRATTHAALHKAMFPGSKLPVPPVPAERRLPEALVQWDTSVPQGPKEPMDLWIRDGSMLHYVEVPVVEARMYSLSRCAYMSYPVLMDVMAKLNAFSVPAMYRCHQETQRALVEKDIQDAVIAVMTSPKAAASKGAATGAATGAAKGATKAPKRARNGM